MASPTQTRVLLLRAVNVGGASLPMAGLREVLAGLGARDVRTHLASGNAVCAVPADGPEDPALAAFDAAVTDAVEARFGFRRETISRSPEQVAAALAAHPFEVVDPRFSYVSFLLTTPEPGRVEAAADVPTGPDAWALVGQELHLRYADGMGRATLDLDRLQRRLGVVGTARNLRTVAALADLASA